MLPVKCFTCGNVLADKYKYYTEKTCEKKNIEVTYAIKNDFTKTIEGKALDDLGLNNICCRRHMLTHVELD